MVRKFNSTTYRVVTVLGLLCSGVATLIAITSNPVDAEVTKKAVCDYTLYLQQPLPRAKFLAMRNQMYDATQQMADPDVRYQLQDSIPKNHPKRYIDDVSQGCLGCHEESGAVKKFGSSNPNGFDNSNMAKMSHAHPIGVLYEKRTLYRKDLRSSADFPPNMVLMEGHLSCITCHDPMNLEGNHLAEKDRGTLCFNCHNM